MALVRRQPSRELVSLHDTIDRMFDESFMRPMWPRFGLEAREAGHIPLDIAEEESSVVVKASVPGIKPEELNVQLRDDVLSISGEVKEEKERKEENYHLREHRYGRFERSVTLPCPVLSDKAEAVFENGMLTLTLPKAAETQSKRISVKVKK
jgi:HSP20 family protein